MSSRQLPRGIEAWVAALSGAEVPVLARTISEIGKLRRREDDVTGREISNVVLRDPLFTLRILRYIESRRKPEQPAEITTIEHAIMMLGAMPFFSTCTQLASVESKLSGNAKGLAGYRQVLSRASHAATYARSWAAHRSDAESDEVIIATLLHDLAEMMLWCFYPQAAIEIGTLLEQEPGLRSAEAQQRVLGITLHDLQLALCTTWKLPNLLRDLMDDTQAHVPRVKNVVLAVSLARHSAHGWEDAGLPDDYAATAAFLKLPQREVCERIVRLTISAAATDSWYEVPGTASFLPALLPFENPDAPRGIATGLKRAQEKLLSLLIELLPARHRAPDDANASLDAVRTLVNAAVHMLHTELGMPRTMFAAAAAQQQGGIRLAAAATAGADGAALKHFSLSGDEPNVLGHLQEKGGSIWISPDNREAMNALLTPALVEQIGDGEFVATAIKPGAGPVLGILFADRGRGSGGMDLTMATACNHLARFLGLCIVKLRESEERALAAREVATSVV
jgi:HD-like signal output (HDOD) protein